MESKKQGQRHVALVPFLAHDHMVPMLVLCKSLARRGFKCTLISAPDNISKLTYSCFIHGIKPLELVEIAMPLVQLQGQENASASQFSTRPDRPVHKLKDPVKAALNQLCPLDFVVSDIRMPPASTDLGIPTVAWYGGSALNLLRLWYFATKDEDNMPEPEIIRDIHLGEEWDIDASNVTECVRKCCAVVLNTTDTLEAEFISDMQRYMKKTVIPLGNLLIKEEPYTARWSVCNLCIKWLDLQASSSVLYIGFDGICGISNGQIEEIAVGLDRSGVPFLWVLAEQEESRLPEWFEERIDTQNKGMVLKGMVFRGWVPQEQILAHPSVGGFMSRCGWNSVHKALFYGLPIVAVPMQSEQDCNARVVTRVVKAGFEAQKGEGGLYGNESIYRIVRRVMVDDEGAQVRKNAADIGHAFSAEVCSPDANIDRLVEQVLGKAV